MAFFVHSKPTEKHKIPNRQSNYIFLQLLLGAAARPASLIIPFLKRSTFFYILSSAFSYIFCGFFAAASAAKLADVIDEMTAVDITAASKLLVFIWFSLGPVVYSYSFVCCSYMRAKSAPILSSISALDSILNNLEAKNAPAVVNQQRTFINRWMHLLIWLLLMRFCSLYCVPMGDFIKMFTAGTMFAFMPVKAYIHSFIIRGITTIALVFNFWTSAVFCYLASLLVKCYAKIQADIAFEVTPFSTYGRGSDGTGSTVYLNKLIKFRKQHESILKVLARLHGAFTTKLLLDLCYCFLLISTGIAELSSLTNTGDLFKYWSNFARILIFVIASTVSLWMLAKPSIELVRLNEKTIELVEKMIAHRQTARVSGATVEELFIGRTLLRRLRTKPLVFAAGRVIEIDLEAATTLICSILAFVGFTIARVETYNKLNKT